MDVCFYCRDYPGDRAAARRQELLQPHLAFVEANLEHIRVAGPLYDDKEDMIGSVLIFSGLTFVSLVLGVVLGAGSALAAPSVTITQ